MTWPGSKANLKSIWLKYIKVTDHYKIWSVEEKAEIYSWVRLNTTEYVFLYWQQPSGEKKKKESAHSRVDFSRVEALHGIAVSHWSESLLHAQGEGLERVGNGGEKRVFPEPLDCGPLPVGEGLVIGKELCWSC